MAIINSEAMTNDFFIAFHLAVLVNRQNGKNRNFGSQKLCDKSFSLTLESLKATPKYFVYRETLIGS
jgi:hypothetical protein